MINAFFEAVETNSIETVTDMLSTDTGKALVNEKNSKGVTALHIAAWHGNIEIAKLLLSNNADIDSRSMSRDTPLIYAAYKNQLAMVEFLIEKKAHINKIGSFEKRAIGWAVEQKHEQMALLLMKYPDMKLSERTAAGQSLLICTIVSGLYEAAQTLINMEKARSLIDTADKEGHSPLYYAVEKGNEKLALSLIKKGANIVIEFASKRTILHMAARNNWVSVVTEIKRMDINKEMEVYDKEDLEPKGEWRGPQQLSVKEAQERNANLYQPFVNYVDENGELALHHAAFAGNTDIVNMLVDLENNKYINLRIKNGSTALSIAANCGHIQVVESLLKANANVNTKAEKDQTALYWAMKGKQQAVVLLLVQQVGIDLSETYDGKTIDAKAAEHQWADVVTALASIRAHTYNKNSTQKKIQWSSDVNAQYDPRELQTKYKNERHIRR